MIEGLIGLMARQRGLPVDRRMERRAGRVEKMVGPLVPGDVRLVGELYEAVEYGGGERRKSAGCFYTPRSVVRAIVHRVVSRPLAARLRKLQAPEQVVQEALGFRVCDPAMGTGFFLLEAHRAIVDTVQRRLSMLGAEVDGLQLRRDVVRRCLHGADIDGRAVAIARSLLWLEGGERPEAGVVEADALFAMTGREYDVVLGNPPYGGRLSAAAVQGVGGWLTASGGYQNSALHFLELSVGLVKEGGWVGLILPKSLAYSRGWWSGARLVLPWLRELVDANLAFDDVRLEQVILVVKKGGAGAVDGEYATGRFVKGRVERTGKVARKLAAEAGCLLVGVSHEDLELYSKVWKRCMSLSQIAVSFRGMGIQERARVDGGIEGVDGRNIERWGLKRPLRRFEGEGLGGRKVERLRTRPKIVSQNIVAHVKKPWPHLVLMSAMDTDGLLTLDTVTNTVITDDGVDPWLVLGLLNSEFMSWWALKFVFCNAVRTMHLDADYLGRFPVPRGGVKTGRRIAMMARDLSCGRGGSQAELDGLVCKMYGISFPIR